jgi:hypothetical protein
MPTKSSLCCATILACLSPFLTISTSPDQQATCTMDEKDHVAKYSCPKDFDVVYTGEGTKVCDGACYRSGDPESLKSVIRRMAEERLPRGVAAMLTDEPFENAAKELLKTGRTTVKVPFNNSIEFKTTRSSRLIQ